MAGDWVDDGTVQAAEEFEEFLLSGDGQQRFEADGSATPTTAATKRMVPGTD